MNVWKPLSTWTLPWHNIIIILFIISIFWHAEFLIAQLIKMTFFNDGSLRIRRVVSHLFEKSFPAYYNKYLGWENPTCINTYIPYGLHIFVPYFCTIFTVKYVWLLCAQTLCNACSLKWSCIFAWWMLILKNTLSLYCDFLFYMLKEVSFVDRMQRKWIFGTFRPDIWKKTRTNWNLWWGKDMSKREQLVILIVFFLFTFSFYNAITIEDSDLAFEWLRNVP